MAIEKCNGNTSCAGVEHWNCHDRVVHMCAEFENCCSTGDCAYIKRKNIISDCYTHKVHTKMLTYYGVYYRDEIHFFTCIKKILQSRRFKPPQKRQQPQL